MKKITAFIFCFIAFCVLQSCKKDEEKSISFYHWKTKYSIAEAEKGLLKKANSEKLYLRFFDLVYSQEENRVLPTATLQISEVDSTLAIQIIPVIYIINEVFQKETNPSQINYIAEETLRKILRIKEKHFNINTKFPEIQIDCDWTVSTKDAYFSFLKALQNSKSLSRFGEDPIRFSATVRLHQVKFPEKTGIPPVDEATIMFYNVGDLGSMDETNSILNLEKTESYLSRLHEYPLKFNVALPIFGWGILYRDDKLAGILSDIDEKQFKQSFTPLDKEHWFVATEETYINGSFIYKGDKLRMENVTFSDFKKLQKLISKAAGREYSVILYHINSTTPQNLNIDELLETVH
ncbi:hypothetical protein Aeqsu_1798 [Aequorivita sublithincola DSM 14238]|uniref:Lipoprotein n=1 Tax=Aequorivita sublithincola (strain DSM 14238 / LMG 21431 / ACAM 643 / 9-3) TaxID=746697 RepID=I3YWA9_AEQSU|nr:hypothetical protein [Aequorivita sublithincola]AFL81277.1 hypothetical protein Aeqsu_1798 [Aequorivita sublithincola DSM 14238]